MKQNFRRFIYRCEKFKQRLTGKRGALPDFVVIGAQKSGTTSLHAYLSQHPMILKSLQGIAIF